ncbi:hypothetical protein [Roseateles terrae]|uniref:Tfp pilus assembly protein PilF n=1 Tax=Roseateles terrae TaxID=431060 RepID=A0ABR6GW20_9BURK|nr:hypothetical protein [Roseateles terrae]MBB3196313.1 Tfp pilus assembly protein PilF [Roseateles terrae]
MYQQQIAYEPQTAWLYGNYGAFLLCRKDDFKGAVVQFRHTLIADELRDGTQRIVAE